MDAICMKLIEIPLCTTYNKPTKHNVQYDKIRCDVIHMTITSNEKKKERKKKISILQKRRWFFLFILFIFKGLTHSGNVALTEWNDVIEKIWIYSKSEFQMTYPTILLRTLRAPFAFLIFVVFFFLLSNWNL